MRPNTMKCNSPWQFCLATLWFLALIQTAAFLTCTKGTLFVSKSFNENKSTWCTCITGQLCLSPAKIRTLALCATNEQCCYDKHYMQYF